jgi:site-specific recombinase XerD
MRAAIDRYFRIAGIKSVKVNDLRHTFVVAQIQGGVDFTYLAKILGHKRDVSLTRYLQYIKATRGNLNKLVEL